MYSDDRRIVLTLDGGGTNFCFSAIRGNKSVGQSLTLPSNGDHLDRCLATMIEGFDRLKQTCSEPPVAISFALPGPADYPNGVIGDLANLPGFRGGVAVGPMLKQRFGIPSYINNDGDLFTYGEAMAGFLPYVNELLDRAGSPKRYQNLFGITLGTGFGGGITREGRLFIGDNSMAAEVFLLHNKLYPEMSAEETASIRGVRRIYATQAGISFDDAPEPRVIYEIGIGKQAGNQAAAREAFRQLGAVVGDALGNALTLLDGLAVIGGGVAGAWPLFLPAVITELNGFYKGPTGERFPRLDSRAFNLEDPGQLQEFVRGDIREIEVPGGQGKVRYDPFKRVGIGLSRLGTSEAVAIGAYAFALAQLDQS